MSLKQLLRTCMLCWRRLRRSSRLHDQGNSSPWLIDFLRISVGSILTVWLQFTCRTIIVALLAAARATRDFWANQLHPHFEETHLFVNEHLKLVDKALLSRAKRPVKEDHLDLAWVKEGKILLRLTAQGRMERVRTLEELDKICPNALSGGWHWYHHLVTLSLRFSCYYQTAGTVYL